MTALRISPKQCKTEQLEHRTHQADLNWLKTLQRLCRIASQLFVLRASILKLYARGGIC